MLSIMEENGGCTMCLVSGFTTGWEADQVSNFGSFALILEQEFSCFDSKFDIGKVCFIRQSTCISGGTVGGRGIFVSHR